MLWYCFLWWLCCASSKRPNTTSELTVFSFLRWQHCLAVCLKCAQGHGDCRLAHPFTEHGHTSGSWSSGSVLFLFRAVLTLVNQLVRFCIQSFTGFSLHLEHFCGLNKIASSSFWGFLCFIFASEMFFKVSPGLVVSYFTVAIYW